jgi:hypothetical protein
MKYAILPIAAALLAGSAFAEEAVVKVPADITDPAVAAAYTAELLGAIKKVCYRESAPVIGSSYYIYLACVKDTRAEVAKREPTGLLAERLGRDSAVTLAAK